MKRLLVIFGLILALLVSVPSLMADDDHGHGNGHGNKHHDDDQGWEKRQNYEYRTYYVGPTSSGMEPRQEDWLGRLRHASGAGEEVRLPHLRL